jgi:hypothetical protein
MTATPTNVVPMAPTVTPAAASNAELLAVIAEQAKLIQAQGAVVRDLETQLGLAPGGTPLVPGAGANLQNLIDINLAAIRTQAAYSKHLAENQLADANP